MTLACLVLSCCFCCYVTSRMAVLMMARLKYIIIILLLLMCSFLCQFSLGAQGPSRERTTTRKSLQTLFSFLISQTQWNTKAMSDQKKKKEQTLTTGLSHWDFFHEKIESLSPEKDNCDRVARERRVHSGCFSFSLIHRTLIWTTGSLTCAQMLMHAIAHGGVRTP